MSKSFKYLALLSLTLLTTTSIFAKHKLVNTITFVNNTQNDVAYRVLSTNNTGDNLYGIYAQRASKYTAKYGDTEATFEVGTCNKINFAGLCTEAEANSTSNCVGNNRYNAYKVKRVLINSASSCTVVCQDGGPSSCMVK